MKTCTDVETNINLQNRFPPCSCIQASWCSVLRTSPNTQTRFSRPLRSRHQWWKSSCLAADTMHINDCTCSAHSCKNWSWEQYADFCYCYYVYRPEMNLAEGGHLVMYFGARPCMVRRLTSRILSKRDKEWPHQQAICKVKLSVFNLKNRDSSTSDTGQIR